MVEKSINIIKHSHNIKTCSNPVKYKKRLEARYECTHKHKSKHASKSRNIKTSDFPNLDNKPSYCKKVTYHVRCGSTTYTLTSVCQELLSATNHRSKSPIVIVLQMELLHRSIKRVPSNTNYNIPKKW